MSGDIVPDPLLAPRPPAPGRGRLGMNAALVAAGLLGAAGSAGVPPTPSRKQRRYYDPGTNPFPKAHESSSNAPANIPVLTRQVRRSIERELDKGYARGRREAKHHGWEVLPAGAQPGADEQQDWLAYWRRMLHVAVAVARGQKPDPSILPVAPATEGA